MCYFCLSRRGFGEHIVPYIVDLEGGNGSEGNKIGEAASLALPDLSEKTIFLILFFMIGRYLFFNPASLQLDKAKICIKFRS